MKNFVMVMGLLVSAGGVWGQAATAASYPKMAPLAEYMMADRSAEIALARSAAPESIAKDAAVMVLEKSGYVTAVHGAVGEKANGFVCLVQRGWAATTDNPDFWNPKLRAPNCFNAAAARSYLPIYLMKTKMVLAGKKKSELVPATEAAFQSGALPRLEAGAMVYMMSKQQYLSDRDKQWHPHVMFYVAGDAEKSWGLNMAGSPLMGGSDAEEHVTIVMMVASHWSDGSAAEKME